MENNENINIVDDEEQGIDFIAIMRNLWVGRKTIIICTSIFLVLGLVSALTMKRTYTVQTVMVPQLGNSGNSSFNSLASLAGIDMGMAGSNGELSPLLYPQIVNSVPFRRSLIHAPLHFAKCDTLISILDYAKSDYEHPSVFDYVKRYTIGLPGVILGSMRSKPQEIVLPDDGPRAAAVGPRPIVVSLDEQRMMEAMGNIVTLNVDKKEGYITLVVSGREPIMTADLALKAQQLLQDEVTRLRIQKSMSDLEYIQARYEEAKREADRNQEVLASVTDRSQNMATTRAQIERSRAQSKYNVANAVYSDLAKQLEQAKMQVKKDTPIFTIIQPVTVPMKPSNSRTKVLVIWVFFGVVVGCGIVMAKDYWPKFKEKLSKPDAEATAQTTISNTTEA